MNSWPLFNLLMNPINARRCDQFALQVGKGRILREGDRVALLGYGSAVQYCLAAAALVERHGLKVTVADARFCKPLDHALIRSLAKSHEVLITVEEGSIGGFGSHVAQFMALDGLLDGKLKASCRPFKTDENTIQDLSSFSTAKLNSETN